MSIWRLLTQEAMRREEWTRNSMNVPGWADWKSAIARGRKLIDMAPLVATLIPPAVPERISSARCSIRATEASPCCTSS